MGFGEEIEWRRRGWPTGRVVAERERGASGRENAEMREKERKGK